MASSAAAVLSRLLQNAARPKKSSQLPPSLSLVLLHINSNNFAAAFSVLSSIPKPLSIPLYSRLLRISASLGSVVDARHLESHIISTHHPRHPPTFLLNRTIETYAACGSLRDARELFDEMPRRNGGTWNAIISAYASAGHSHDAILLFSRMNKSGSARPNDVSFACALGSCADLLALLLARQIHCLVLKYGFAKNVILSTSVVDVYGKCGVMSDARKMFDEMRERNAVSWNVIVRRYLEMDEGEEAVILFFRMIGGGVRPLNFTVSNALVACSDVSALEEGCQIHGFAVKLGFDGDHVVENSLMEMYAKNGLLEDARKLFDDSTSRDVVSWTSIVSGYALCGRIAEAEKLFDNMPERNVVSWNAMLAGYVRCLCWDKALDFIFLMAKESEEMDDVSLKLILNVCAGVSHLELGKQVHGFVFRHGFCSNLFISNALVDMYGKCGNLRSAELWFLSMASNRDKISWNALISGYTRHGRSDEALHAFGEMQWETTPNEFTFSTALAACANIFMLRHGKQIHARMIRNDVNMDVIIRGALVDMYCKCRSIEYAIKVFEEATSKDIILWNSMIMGCAYNGRGEYGLELFEMMLKDGTKADNVTFIAILLACITEGYVDLGRQYFNLMSDEFGIIPRVEHYECMIELLGKHGFMVELEDFVEQMPFEPTIPMWMRIFDCCREHCYARLGERAERRINESNPLNPVQFNVCSGPTIEPS
ncbi:putative tetratricopeptide-like helical domain superfamily [Dioscorea sansibarensis]